MDADDSNSFLPRVEAEWRSRFSAREHHDLSVTPSYLVEDAAADMQERHLLQAGGDEEALREDAARFLKCYLRDAQSVFSRVQHHVHLKTKRGYKPLKACMSKTKKGEATCKHDFPKTKFRLRRSPAWRSNWACA